MESNERIFTLLRYLIDNEIKHAELDELFILIQDFSDKELFNLIGKSLDETPINHQSNIIKERVEVVRNDILSEIQVIEKLNKRRKYARFLFKAASIAVLLVGFYSIYVSSFSPVEKQNLAVFDIPPGVNKAIITVDGQDYFLEDEKNGLVLLSDSISYIDGSPFLNIPKDQNIRVRTPYGGQYQLVLVDGTKVWLNAGSEISYNADFGREHRVISLVGEAFFDVAHDPNSPFKLQVGNQQIEVLGTAFNVHAYAEEYAIKTTLNNGSLLIRTSNQELLLKPGQQSALDLITNNILVNTVDPSAVASWKEGVFDLNGLKFEECMRMIARWYNIAVVYQSDFPNISLAGKMSKGVKLSTFLQFLEKNYNVNSELTSDRKLTLKIDK